MVAALLRQSRVCRNTAVDATHLATTVKSGGRNLFSPRDRLCSALSANKYVSKLIVLCIWLKQVDARWVHVLRVRLKPSGQMMTIACGLATPLL